VLSDDGRLTIDLNQPMTTSGPVGASHQGSEHLSQWGLRPGCAPEVAIEAAARNGWKLERRTGHDGRVLVFLRAQEGGEVDA
jgi:hypothetical protein